MTPALFTLAPPCHPRHRNGEVAHDRDRSPARCSVRHLEAAGYRFERGAWRGSDASDVSESVGVLDEADAMHALLMRRSCRSPPTRSWNGTSAATAWRAL